MSEHTKEIRFYIGEIVNLLAKIEASEPGGTTPIDPVVVAPPPTDPVAGDIEWHPNGFSRKADFDGFGLIKAITEHEAKFKWPLWLKAKTARRFNAEALQREAEFPSFEAKLKSAQNLGRRFTTIQMIPPMYTMDAILVGIVRKPGSPDRDYNMSPEDQAKVRYTYTDDAILVCEEGKGAWSTNWNPAFDAEYLTAQHLKWARDQVLAVGKDPAVFGL